MHQQLDEGDLVERGQKYVRNLSELPSYISLASPGAHAQQQANVLPTSFGRFYSSMQLPLPSSLITKRPPQPPSTAAHGSALSAGIAQTHPQQQHHRSSSSSSAATADAGETTDYAALLSVLRSPRVTAADVEFIVASSSALASVMLEGSIVPDDPAAAPKIVLTFEELLNK
jgi:hypothetical protein